MEWSLFLSQLVCILETFSNRIEFRAVYLNDSMEVLSSLLKL
jgi:hypothetical protein